ncbi:MAG: methyltransferase domain-containing protein [Burkholderiaceae bacterium]|nr:methyltransferase domain-containing protein [Burkholderiaceae bacterium]
MSDEKTPDFLFRDPAAPTFWDERFEKAFMPWDRAGVPAALRDFVERSAPMVTLIPGCGLGHEVALFASAGWDVTAIDFSAAAVRAARANLGSLAEHVMEADFFSFEPPHRPQLIYERAFLCALAPALRTAIVERWAALLPPGGLLAGYFFFGETMRGPPFGIGAAQLETLLQPHFARIEDAEVQDSIPVFIGKERWQVWRRR